MKTRLGWWAAIAVVLALVSCGQTDTGAVEKDAVPETTGIADSAVTPETTNAPEASATAESSVTLPFVLDHNRMLVDAQMQKKDGSWRNVRLWVDTGNPEFFLSEELARDLGIDLTAQEKTADGRVKPLDVVPPSGVKIGALLLQISGIPSKVMFEPTFLFSTMHIDANLPSTVLKHFHVVFDYPNATLTIAKPGNLEPRGKKTHASLNPDTGIVQIDATIDGDTYSFALDNGASFSFVSDDLLHSLMDKHPDWPRHKGAVGCANIWGWWPKEFEWPMTRVPEILWGSVPLRDVGLVGLPKFFPNSMDLAQWYSIKSIQPVHGFLGPNAFKTFRVEIDYANLAVYFEKGEESNAHDMDLVGLTLRPMTDGTYQVIGVAEKDGKRAVDGIKPGDALLKIGELEVKGSTMGAVVDALRGNPGDERTLVLERDGRKLTIEAKVMRFL
jgi:hypothetical protein